MPESTVVIGSSAAHFAAATPPLEVMMSGGQGGQPEGSARVR
jgi:hypothetical protein